MMQEKTGACMRCKAACFAWQRFCGAACSAKYEAGDRTVELALLDGLQESVLGEHLPGSGPAK